MRLAASATPDGVRRSWMASSLIEGLGQVAGVGEHRVKDTLVRRSGQPGEAGERLGARELAGARASW